VKELPVSAALEPPSNVKREISMSTFRNLHSGPDLLRLPNAWDAGSARLIESLGAKAIATTSAGLAWSRGYPDGDALAREPLLVATREIARVIRVPLTVDIEGGYSDDPAAVAQLATQLIDAGAVGINLEDKGGAPERLCAKIEAIKKSVARSGVDFFINARTDVYLRELATGEAAVQEVVRRARLYRDAGCDGLFVPLLADPGQIAAVVRAIETLPLNLMLVPRLPTDAELQQMGVRRLSAGAAIAKAVLGRVRQLTSGFLAGAREELFTAPIEYGAMNNLFARSTE
jgi:2-methylisocitrate lyase-like PEP mutase family enzyme